LQELATFCPRLISALAFLTRMSKKAVSLSELVKEKSVFAGSEPERLLENPVRILGDF
jgi:hypothetical protein